MIDQMGTFLRIGHGSAILIGIAILLTGILIGAIIGFKGGRKWQIRKEPETQADNRRLHLEVGRLERKLEKHRIYIKSCELAKHELDEGMRRI